jgi:hypothetical protein
MQIRFVTKPVHAYLIDYPVAIVLIVAPFVLKLGQGGSAAIWLSVVAGVAALMLAAMTDHPTGVVKLIPYSLSGSTASLASCSWSRRSHLASLGPTPGTTGCLA